ncbi:lipopolysaccharide ABC transporter membrane protein LptF [Desulfuromonas sp. DDH964]|uniref:LPS export ABC transporter permease LptF n=1 Tax=Desulfuromonas sp. DDH964 TaxID=1823759 RepID=UPI00078CE86B|nr:LPS export ABC transporter permease LptF [Desulfuromonas sp. DDH964]AMV72550.1 lipopolysaccharide ABC transporter membrane protein LptF [Desulfuromonas sp. DDH964]
MSAHRIHRYIAREVTIPALLGLLVFTFVLILGRLLKLAELVINQGVPLGQITTLFAYLMPTFLVITIPLGFLLGVLLGFTRLSTDNEITAFKSTGVSLYRLLRPVLFCALAASTLTALATLVIAPACKQLFRSQVFEIALNQASIKLQPRTFNTDFNGLAIYANGVDEQSGTMQGILIADERSGSAPAVILARSGRIIPDSSQMAVTLRLNDGTIHRKPEQKSAETYQLVSFANYDINLNLGQQTPSKENRYRKPSEYALGELITSLRTAPDAADRAGFSIELQRRLILPLAPLLFALIGVPLGVQSNRSGRSSGFALALIVFLLYYMFLSLAQTLVEEKNFPVILTMWSPSVLFFAASIYLLRITASERRLPLADWIRDRWRVARRLLRRRGLA